ncbi:hypothetical protein AURDEDRAFT_177439 [Auricularia subglabra TFB-10046 SS5]|uniref:Uncharacterized protein n=1 Tax=Auricularia subglabra (strain TFB-10046 / SS5) TaxID=717982 RepID=J0WMC2_AURST|nr:hypothetical protein AURDEDRAFT_177439 [Auricularia subglabra TFB-10046 SS5]
MYVLRLPGAVVTFRRPPTPSSPRSLVRRPAVPFSTFALAVAPSQTSIPFSPPLLIPRPLVRRPTVPFLAFALAGAPSQTS